jgi:hypothetical protein
MTSAFTTAALATWAAVATTVHAIWRQAGSVACVPPQFIEETLRCQQVAPVEQELDLMLA